MVGINSFDLGENAVLYLREESFYERSENWEQPLGAEVEDEGVQIKLMNEVMLHSCPQ